MFNGLICIFFPTHHNKNSLSTILLLVKFNFLHIDYPPQIDYLKFYKVTLHTTFIELSMKCSLTSVLLLLMNSLIV